MVMMGGSTGFGWCEIAGGLESVGRAGEGVQDSGLDEGEKIILMYIYKHQGGDRVRPRCSDVMPKI